VATAPRHACLLTASVHTPAEARRARRLHVHAAFVSPVFETASHPGARPLGRFGFARLARRLHCPAIALGGMNAARFRRLMPLGAHGHAAIDSWLAPPPVRTPPQKASAPPI
jgi:thiamine-phosphate pyrophosphorylase